MNKIMKKMYIQPNVEAAEVQATSLMQAGSPGTLQDSGKGTGSLGGGEIIGG